MQLSENFTLEELIATQTGIENVPGPVEKDKLLYLTTYILQPIRNYFGVRVFSTSGYRSLAVNTKVGGSPKSQHMLGEADDFQVEGIVNLKNVMDWIIEDSHIEFGQCIHYVGGNEEWIHISLPRLSGPNNQALTKNIATGERKPYG